MPSEKPRPPQRTWRSNVGANAPANDAQPKWKRTSAPAGPRGTGWSWRSKAMLGAGFAAVVAVGLLILAKVLIPPKVPYLVLVGATYQENLTIPHNVYGWRAIEDLSKWSQAENPRWWEVRHRPRVPAGELTEVTAPGDWRADLQKSFREDTVVLYLALHGGADNKKGAFLFLDDVQGKARIYVSEILEELKRLDEKKRKILILDATQVTANWPVGMLGNDFARKLRELDSQIRAVQNLIVISSSGENQRSWVIEEAGRTIFGHAIVEGLQGTADRDRDDRVTGWEIYQSVTGKVQTWAKFNRHATQIPVLLPEGPDGQKRAEEIELAVVPERDGPSERPSFDLEMGADLTSLWTKFEERRTRPLSPATYAPHYWRQYQDMLLRYEQLLRAKGNKADAVKSRLEKLAWTLDNSQKIVLKHSEQNTLPLAFALGLTQPVDAARDDALTALWDMPAEQWKSEWEKLKVQARNAQPTAHLGTFLLKKALEVPQRGVADDANRNKAGEMLKSLLGSGNDQPAELHYLAMLCRGDFDANAQRRPQEADVRKSLELRQMAEEVAWATRSDGAEADPTHPYAEAVYPWIAEQVAKADQLRRFGEDHLFGTDERSWAEARKYALEASQVYAQAHAHARIVRAAYDARDRVMAELPYYSRWLLQDYSGNRPDAEFANLRKESLALWEQTHQLARQLETQDPRSIVEKPANRPDDVSLKDRTETIRKGLADVAVAFQRACDHEKLDEHFQENWLAIQDLLTVPYVDASDRKKLIGWSRETARKLNVETPTTAEVAVPAGDDLHYKDVTFRQGEMALAQLGRDTFKEAKPAGSDYGAALELLRHPDPTYHLNVAQQLGENWQRNPIRIDEFAQTAQKADLQAARKALMRADWLCRCLPSGLVGRLSPLAADSVTELRRHRVHDLLLANAERTVNDFWAAAGKEAGARPYFLDAAQGYVDDARTQIAREGMSTTALESRLANVEEWYARLKSPPTIALQGPVNDLQVTSETRFVISNSLKTEGAVPPGFPALWFDPESQKLQLAAEERERLAHRALKQLGAGTAPPTFEYYLQPAENLVPPLYPKPIEAKTVAKGFYRGHILDAQTTVNLHLRPDVVALRKPPVTDCAIAVMADPEVFDRLGGANSAIVIVLDCSGSMYWVGGKPQPSPTRFDKAQAALKRVLREIPKGANVSLWVFGQEEGASRNISPNRTIKPLWSKLAWDPENGGQIDRLMKEVANLKPYHETPLVRAMAKAKSDFAGVKGFKTMLVLTDGEDTEFKNDNELNPTPRISISQFLKDQFDKQAIQVNVVGFQVPASERPRIETQFESLKKLTPLPGQFKLEQDADELVSTLGALLKYRLTCRLLRDGIPLAGPDIPKDGIDVGTPEALLQPFPVAVPSANYELVVNVFKQRVDLRAGDRLLVRLHMKPNGEVGFERALYSETEKQKVLERGSDDDWVVCAMQDQIRDDAHDRTRRARRMFVTVEESKAREPKNGYIQQIYPHFTWFEVEASGHREPVALTFRNPDYYPAPAWSLDVAEWPPGDSAPKIRAWWLDEIRPDVLKLENGQGPNLAAGNWKGSTKGDTIEIESVTFEDDRATLDREKRRCMVVRLKTPNDKPAIAWLEGFTGAVQHQVYRQANRTTSIFWDVTADEMKAAKNMELGVISLDHVKNKQKASSVELKLEVPPSPVSQAPPELR